MKSRRGEPLDSKFQRRKRREKKLLKLKMRKKEAENEEEEKEKGGRRRKDSLGSSSWALAPVPGSDPWSSEGHQELPLLRQEEEVTSHQKTTATMWPRRGSELRPEGKRLGHSPALSMDWVRFSGARLKLLSLLYVTQTKKKKKKEILNTPSSSRFITTPPPVSPWELKSPKGSRPRRRVIASLARRTAGS